MVHLFIMIGINILISTGIYLAITSILILTGHRAKSGDKADMSFRSVKTDYSGLPGFEHYPCMDGSRQDCRCYPSESETVLILIHGSGSDSRYFLPLASWISSGNLAHVYTPDLRGHGTQPVRRGDIDYISQLVDDLADLVTSVREKHPASRIIVGGHSSGGGLALRFAGSRYASLVDGWVFLAPYLKYNSPTMRKNTAGSWAAPRLPSIIGLTMLNNIGIRFFNHLKVIDFNMPSEYRDGMETLCYSFCLNTGIAPHNYKKELKAIKKKALVLVGSSDETFFAVMYPSVIGRYNPAVQVTLLDGVNHIGVVTGEECRSRIADFIHYLE